MAAGTAKAFSTTYAAANGPRKGLATGVIVNSTQSEDDKLDFTGFRSLAVKPSASVTSLTFYGSETIDGTYVLITSLGTAGVVTVTASVWNVIDATKTAPFCFIQMKSDQSAATASVLAST